jgi:GAF domain-containing protein
MKRRSRAGREPIKGRRPKTPKPTPRVTRKIEIRSNPSPVAEENNVARLARERDEALEQQTATSEVLRIISASLGELEPVFQAMLERAVRICDATFGNIFRWDGDAFHLMAAHKTPPAFAKTRKLSPIRPTPTTLFGRLVATKSLVHTPDLAAERQYVQERRTTYVEAVELGGIRAFLIVPMLKNDQLIGAIGLFRHEVRPFTDRQIELVKGFAAQAVIAIENARLLNELRQSLEQQTATADVLQVVSSSPGNLEPVFATMLEKAVRICDATFGNVYRWDGEALHLVATHNTPPAFAEARKQSLPSANPIVSSILKTKTPFHIPDAAAQQGYIDRSDLAAVQSVELGGVRTFLAVPMLKEDEVIGSFTVYRQEVHPFTDKQIEFVKNFAAQAVIAIENARLLNELRQRTDDLTEALDQQRATSDLLQVISGSPGNLEPVFQAMLENAVTICGANFGNMLLYENEAFRIVAMYNAPEAYAKVRTGGPFYPPPESGLGRLATTKEVVQIADLRTEGVELGGIRTVIDVPLLKEGNLVGAIVIYRQEIRPFSEKQIELVKSFADQVVIAIENSRLLNELRDRTNELERSYALVQEQARQLEAQAKQLEQRVTDQVDEIERMSRLRRFLPPQVADLIVASGSEKQLESHRREITALFCDLRGFTGFTESADAEDVIALLRDYHAAIGELQLPEARHGLGPAAPPICSHRLRGVAQ